MKMIVLPNYRPYWYHWLATELIFALKIPKFCFNQSAVIELSSPLLAKSEDLAFNLSWKSAQVKAK